MENSENKQSNKAHLLYMTGLSLNKQLMNNITENINYDKDFTYWRELIVKEFESINSKTNKVIGIVDKLANKEISHYIDSISDVSDIFDVFEKDSTFEKVSDKNIEDGTKKIRDKIKKPFQSISNKIFKDLIGYKSLNDEFKAQMLKDFIKKNENLIINQYKNSDFFSLYLSHQSDSIGLVPLAKLSNEKHFNIMHSYCDWDFFDNQYIDHVILKIDTKKLPKPDYINYKEIFEEIFKLHIRELMFSKALSKTYKVENTENITSTKSILDILLNKSEKYDVHSILKILGDRNFFGISLLSQILDCIDNITSASKQKGILIDEKDNSKSHHFLKELLEMSSNPSSFQIGNININKEELNQIENFISAKIYFSDGLKLTKSVGEIENIDDISLLNDNYFLYTCNPDNASETLINESQNEKYQKEQIEKYFSNTVNRLAQKPKKINFIQKFKNKYFSKKIETPNINYIHQLGNGELYIKIPIKMVLSLPIDENSEPNSDIFIPACLNNDNKDVIDILTVGGAEHNRALAHLINKHRLFYKDDRLFGFMDNHADMIHKHKLDEKNTLEDSYNFFMGLNQPVSGWNYILNLRTNDKDGNSINSDVKFITFKLDENQKFNIVSIYGFSAIASVLGTNIFIAELSKRDDIKNSLFEGHFSKIFELSSIKEPKGATATIFFDEKEENNGNKEIKLKVMKEFNGKCYQYQFNNNLEKFIEILRFEDNYNSLYTIMKGRSHFKNGKKITNL